MSFARLAAIATLCLVAACSAPMHGFYVPGTRFTAYTPARPLIAENEVVPYSGALPACADPNVLAKMQERFASRETGYWESALRIIGFGEPYEIASRPHGPYFVPRRFCSVTAQFSDNRWRKISYSIDEDTGLFGFGPGITWCAAGLDRDMTYAPDCKMARP
jgi:hypothetical protein